jgi:hypothetical protein
VSQKSHFPCHVTISIPISEQQSAAGTKIIRFLDAQGQQIRELRYSCNDTWLEGACIDYKNQRVLELKAEYYRGKNPGIIKGLKSKKFTVYKSNGEVLLSFQQPDYSLLPFSKKFFLGSTVQGHASAGYSTIINLSGEVVRTIKGLDYPQFKDNNEDLFLVGDQNCKLWVLDSLGQPQFSKEVLFNNKVTISDDNQICLSYLSEIFILDSSGSETFRFQPYTPRSNGEAIISKSGNLIFFAYSKSRNQVGGIRKDGLVGIIDLETHTVSWKQEFSAP